MALRVSTPYVRAGDTEPLEFTLSLTATAQIQLADVSAVVLYGRVVGVATNQIDGVACTVAGVTATDNGDGTWSVDIACSFDPLAAGPAGADAFALTFAAGVTQHQLRCYARVTYTDADTTRHPAADDGTLDLYITKGYE